MSNTSFAVWVNRLSWRQNRVRAVFSSMYVYLSEGLLSKVEVLGVFEIFRLSHFEFVSLVILENVT